MRFDDLEILDLNGDEEEILRFPSDNPTKENDEKNIKESADEDEVIDWKKEIKSFAFTLPLPPA